MKFKTGDKVQCADGTIIRIGGMATGRFYHEHACALVAAETETTADRAARLLAEANAAGGDLQVKPVGGAATDDDCIVWSG